VHAVTLADLPADEVGPLFLNAQLLQSAIEDAMGADGIFIGDQQQGEPERAAPPPSYRPRKKKDGLRGFFWPRQKYPSEESAHPNEARESKRA